MTYPANDKHLYWYHISYTTSINHQIDIYLFNNFLRVDKECNKGMILYYYC